TSRTAATARRHGWAWCVSYRRATVDCMNASMSAAGRAPDVRPASFPPTNTAIVGIDWILNRSPRSGSASVFTLTIRNRPALRPATLASSGATTRQGAHQAAQKSTTTGRDDCAIVASNAAESGVSIGSDGADSGVWHLPQRVSAASRPYASRLRCPHDGHG